MFFPGETISHSFVIPFATEEIKQVLVSYKQNDHIVLEKTITSGFTKMGAGISRFTIVFTQTDSLLFEDNMNFTAQINVLTIGGTRHASHEVKSSSGVQYLREVMSDG